MNKENQVLKMVANEAVTKEHIMDYLDVVKNNLSLSVLNQAMVYLQKSTAKMVCGKKAWESMGRTIKEGARPIVLFFPTIQMTEPPEEYEIDGVPQVVEGTDVQIHTKEAVYANHYIPVNAFDLDSTEGEYIPDATPKHEPFMDTILEITQATSEFADTKKANTCKGEYDIKQNVFYFSNELSGLDTEYKKQECDKAAIYMYLDYIFHSYNLTDKCLRTAIRYVLCERYNIKTHSVGSSLFTKLDKKTEAEKLDFLYLLQYFTSNIVQDFEGHYLTFNETAFVNDIFSASDATEMWRAFDDVIRSIEDDLLKDELANFRTKLMRSEEGYLEELLSLRNEKKVYTYPPVRIDLNKTDYLRDEREKLLNSIELILPSQLS